MAASSWKKGKSEHSRKQQQSIRDTIHLLLSILSECGMPRVSCECLRRAKFNKPDAAQDLWKLTFHTIQTAMVLDGSTCDGNIETLTYLQVMDSNLPTVQSIVHRYMFELGYKREEFYSTPNAPSSRELLLAFAWLLHRTSFFTKLADHYVKASKRREVPLKHTSRHLTEHVIEENTVVGCELDTITTALKKCGDSTLQSASCTELLYKLSWLRGRLDLKFKSVQNLSSAYVALANKIHNFTGRRGAGKEEHLSVHEIFLLRYPIQMRRYLTKLQKCVGMLQKVVRWQDCEPLFWQWMESVLDLEEVEEEKKSDEEHKKDTEPNRFEDVHALSLTVQRQQEEFEALLAKSKHRVEKVEHMWSHKSKILCHKDINGRLHLLRSQLQFEYPITVLTHNQAVLVSSTAEQVCPIDVPLCANPHTSVQCSLPTPVQQEADNKNKLVTALGERLQVILQEVAALDRAIRQKKSEIKNSLESMEKVWLPATVCKIESNIDI